MYRDSDLVCTWCTHSCEFSGESCVYSSDKKESSDSDAIVSAYICVVHIFSDIGSIILGGDSQAEDGWLQKSYLQSFTWIELI